MALNFSMFHQYGVWIWMSPVASHLSMFYKCGVWMSPVASHLSMFYKCGVWLSQNLKMKHWLWRPPQLAEAEGCIWSKNTFPWIFFLSKHKYIYLRNAFENAVCKMMGSLLCPHCADVIVWTVSSLHSANPMENCDLGYFHWNCVWEIWMNISRSDYGHTSSINVRALGGPDIRARVRQNPVGPLWNFARGPNGPPKLENW